MDVRGLKFSASLAYYTVFSLAPLLVLTITLAGFFFGTEAVEGKVFDEINGLVGNSAATQIEETIRNVEVSGKSNVALVLGIFTLLLGATTVFGDMQHSINKIWAIKAKPKRGWLKLIQDRLLSSSLIISLAFLLVVSLIVNGLLVIITDYLNAYLSDLTIILSYLINTAVSLLVVALLFGIIFKFLPDVNIKWKHVRAGALFTTFLFMIGKWAINLYIQTTGTASTYGAAGSIIVILLWIYYTAAILYLGASFTRIYVESKGESIAPAEYAVYVEEKETEKEVKRIPPTDIEGKA